MIAQSTSGRQIDETRSAGGDKQRITCTTENIEQAAQLVISQENAPGTHRSVSEIAREKDIEQYSVHIEIVNDVIKRITDWLATNDLCSAEKKKDFFWQSANGNDKIIDTSISANYVISACNKVKARPHSIATAGRFRTHCNFERQGPNPTPSPLHHDRSCSAFAQTDEKCIPLRNYAVYVYNFTQLHVIGLAVYLFPVLLPLRFGVLTKVSFTDFLSPVYYSICKDYRLYT